MSTVFDDFPDLIAQQRQADRATALLEQAVETLKVAKPGERYADIAQRVRGAAVLVHTAALELAVTAGWFDAAHAAGQHGLLDEEASDG